MTALICPTCNTEVALSGACECDVDGVPPGGFPSCPWPRRENLLLTFRSTTPSHSALMRRLLDRELDRRRGLLAPAYHVWEEHPVDDTNPNGPGRLELVDRRGKPTRKPSHGEQTCRGRDCDQPTRDDVFLCDDCLDELRTDLDKVADIAAALYTIRVGVSGIDYRTLGGSTGGDKEVAWPLTVQATAAYDRLARVLWRQVQVLLQLGHGGPGGLVPPRDAPAALADWLLVHVADLRTHPQFARTPDLVRRALEHGDRVATPPAAREQLGPCPEWIECETCKGAKLVLLDDGRIEKCDACLLDYDGEVEPCGAVPCDGRLTARPDDTYASCYRCEVEVDAWVHRGRLLARLDDEYMPAADIARLVTHLNAATSDHDRDAGAVVLGTPETIRKRINTWHTRGHLLTLTKHPSASNPPTFRFGHVRDLLLANQRTEHRHAWTDAPWTDVVRIPFVVTRQARTCRYDGCTATQTRITPTEGDPSA